MKPPKLCDPEEKREVPDLLEFGQLPESDGMDSYRVLQKWMCRQQCSNSGDHPVDESL